MRERMGKQVFGTKLVANGAVGNVLSPLAALLEPPVSPHAQGSDSILYLRPCSPILEPLAVESEEKPFAELLDGWQPRWICAQEARP